MLNIILLKGVKEKELSDLFLYVTNYLDELPSDFDDSYIKDIIEYMEENKS